MDRREDGLREALASNVEETERWQRYKEEQKGAIKNLETFRKHLTVDVMVPLGPKAYMPGQLIHTNEVLVGHYQGYFSKCTTHKAKEICEQRMRMADDHLQKFKTEAELWQNKLMKPYTDGAMPQGEERDIIEEYNEEKEKLWREQHKLRIKAAKLREKEERKNYTKKSVSRKENSDEELFKLLEDGELMEELEDELNSLQIADEMNDETIRKLIAGEMKLPAEKKRLSHFAQDQTQGQHVEEEDAKRNEELQQHIIKKEDLNASTRVGVRLATNNNVRPNPEIQRSETIEHDDDDLPEEVRLIKEQAKFLPTIDQIGFYEYQIEIIKQKLIALPVVRDSDDINKKIHLHTVLENIEELLEIAEETVGAEELAEKGVSSEEEPTDGNGKLLQNDVDKKKKQKRRISFAMENDTLEFRRNDSVAQLMPSNSTNEVLIKRDVIVLDDPMVGARSPAATKPTKQKLSVEDRKQKILNKVEENLNYVKENQSKEDFDLVNKIMDLSMGQCRTLHIKFKHSTHQPQLQVRDSTTVEEDDVLFGTPADIYENYLKMIRGTNTQQDSVFFVNGYEGEDSVKIPILRECNRNVAYEDPRMKFSKPNAMPGPTIEANDSDHKGKSILRNKTAVEKETHIKDTFENAPKAAANKKKKKKAVIPAAADEYMSAYFKVMDEVYEKPLEAPEPLPECKYIDSNAPKKRISRFKQMRSGLEKI